MKNLFYGDQFIYWMDICCRCILELPLWGNFNIAYMRQFQCVPTTYVTEIKKTYFEIYTKQVSCTLPSSFKHLKLPISIKIPVTIIANCLYLHERYITKFDFMNFAFAKVVVGTSTPHTSLLELYQLFLTLFSFQTYFNFPRLRAVSNLYRYLISFWKKIYKYVHSLYANILKKITWILYCPW